MNTSEHELKIWPEYFNDVESGKKNFEVRKMDRLFGVGDILYLREWSPIKGYSGRETRKIITYRMNGGQWGLSEGNCILGIATPPPQPLGVNVDELAETFAKGWPTFKEQDSEELLIEGFKAGFAASPQSSTSEEEKDLWNEVGAFILRSDDFEFTGSRMNELLSTYKIFKR